MKVLKFAGGWDESQIFFVYSIEGKNFEPISKNQTKLNEMRKL